MWYETVGRKARGSATRLVAGGGAALLLGLTLAGCAADYVTDSTAPVLLIIASVNENNPLDSDIRNGEQSSFICEDEVDVAVAVRQKNPLAPVPSVPNAVLLKSYEVRYIRTDGRGVEGVDVPYRITGNLTQSVDAAADGATNVRIEVVRRQAKREPPLSTIDQARVLTVMAEITLYGETVSGHRVSASGRMQIDFANFLDTETACPTN